jgi:hypothetical protein
MDFDLRKSLVRHFLDAANHGDAAALKATVVPDAVLALGGSSRIPALAAPSIVRGRDELVKAVERARDAGAGVVTILEVAERGPDAVIVRALAAGIGDREPSPAARQVGFAVRFRDHLISYLGGFQTLQEAEEALTLPPP